MAHQIVNLKQHNPYVHVQACNAESVSTIATQPPNNTALVFDVIVTSLKVMYAKDGAPIPQHCMSRPAIAVLSPAPYSIL